MESSDLQFSRSAFVASSCSEFADLRTAIHHHLQVAGFQTFISEKPDRGVASASDTREACLDAIEGRDWVVVLIGEEASPATLLEIQRAIELRGSKRKPSILAIMPGWGIHRAKTPDPDLLRVCQSEGRGGHLIWRDRPDSFGQLLDVLDRELGIRISMEQRRLYGLLREELTQLIRRCFDDYTKDGSAFPSCDATRGFFDPTSDRYKQWPVERIRHLPTMLLGGLAWTDASTTILDRVVNEGHWLCWDTANDILKPGGAHLVARALSVEVRRIRRFFLEASGFRKALEEAEELAGQFSHGEESGALVRIDDEDSSPLVSALFLIDKTWDVWSRCSYLLRVVSEEIKIETPPPNNLDYICSISGVRMEPVAWNKVIAYYRRAEKAGRKEGDL